MMKRALAVVPDIKPIVIGHYTLTVRGCDVRGRPSFDEHEQVGEFIKHVYKRSGWWLADWMRYGDSREDWNERIDQVVDATGLSAKTCRNVRAIGAIPAAARRPETVEFSLHGEVASMEPDERAHWLELAEVNRWTQRDLRWSIRAARRRKVIDGQAVLEGMYRVIYSDNPWIYRDRPPSGMGAEQHFPGMTIEDQCKLPVAAHALPESVLFMWITAPLALANPGPREVGEAWGFTYKQQWIWDKVDRN